MSLEGVIKTGWKAGKFAAHEKRTYWRIHCTHLDAMYHQPIKHHVAAIHAAMHALAYPRPGTHYKEMLSWILAGENDLAEICKKKTAETITPMEKKQMVVYLAIWLWRSIGYMVGGAQPDSRQRAINATYDIIKGS